VDQREITKKSGKKNKNLDGRLGGDGEASFEVEYDGGGDEKITSSVCTGRGRKIGPSLGMKDQTVVKGGADEAHEGIQRGKTRELLETVST